MPNLQVQNNYQNTLTHNACNVNEQFLQTDLYSQKITR